MIKATPSGWTPPSKELSEFFFKSLGYIERLGGDCSDIDRRTEAGRKYDILKHELERYSHLREPGVFLTLIERFCEFDLRFFWRKFVVGHPVDSFWDGLRGSLDSLNPAMISECFEGILKEILACQNFLLKGEIIVPQIFMPIIVHNNLQEIGKILDVDIPAFALEPDGSLSEPIINKRPISAVSFNETVINSVKKIAPFLIERLFGLDEQLPVEDQRIRKIRGLISPFFLNRPKYSVRIFDGTFANIDGDLLLPLNLSNEHYRGPPIGKTPDPIWNDTKAFVADIFGVANGYDLNLILERHGDKISTETWQIFRVVFKHFAKTKSCEKFIGLISRELCSLRNDGAIFPYDKSSSNLSENLNMVFKATFSNYLESIREIYINAMRLCSNLENDIVNWNLRHASGRPDSDFFKSKVSVESIYELDFHRRLLAQEYLVSSLSIFLKDEPSVYSLQDNNYISNFDYDKFYNKHVAPEISRLESLDPKNYIADYFQAFTRKIKDEFTRKSKEVIEVYRSNPQTAVRRAIDLSCKYKEAYKFKAFKARLFRLLTSKGREESRRDK